MDSQLIGFTPTCIGRTQEQIQSQCQIWMVILSQRSSKMTWKSQELLPCILLKGKNSKRILNWYQSSVGFFQNKAPSFNINSFTPSSEITHVLILCSGPPPSLHVVTLKPVQLTLLTGAQSGGQGGDQGRVTLPFLAYQKKLVKISLAFKVEFSYFGG